MKDVQWRWKWDHARGREANLPVGINARLRCIVFCVTSQQLHHHFGCSLTVKSDTVIPFWRTAFWRFLIYEYLCFFFSFLNVCSACLLMVEMYLNENLTECGQTCLSAWLALIFMAKYVITFFCSPPVLHTPASKECASSLCSGSNLQSTWPPNWQDEENQKVSFHEMAKISTSGTERAWSRSVGMKAMALQAAATLMRLHRTVYLTGAVSSMPWNRLLSLEHKNKKHFKCIRDGAFPYISLVTSIVYVFGTMYNLKQCLLLQKMLLSSTNTSKFITAVEKVLEQKPLL